MKVPLIKVCGVTTMADALYAVKLGADAIGMILYPKSPRFIPLERAKEIASAFPSAVKKVAVVVNASSEELNEIIAGDCFDVLQFHGDEDDEWIGTFQKKIEIWKALSLNSDVEYAQALASPADCIVVDSRTAGAYGGTGTVGNWAFAAKLAAARRVILAGGLTPENSVAAWETVQPAGLDFNSGVETAPGKKDCKKLDALFAKLASKKESIMKPSEVYFGQFGGRYVAETLMPTLYELTDAYEAAKADPAFQQELEYYLKNYIGRESPLTFAANLTATLGGAKIYLKREDLNHTGAHKVNNTIGQALLARRMGKKKVIAETGAGMHGVATATVAALFGMECEVFMGATDIERQAPNVERMKVLGAKIHSVESGTGTLKDAMNEAIRHWIANSADTFYVIGTVAGPAPYPAMVRDFQAVIGKECRRQFQQTHNGRLPDEVIACVGGGSNAMGIFAGFLDDSEVKLIGVEAGGMGIETGEHAASINGGEIGVLHGCKTYLLQTPEGQIVEAYSVSAGLDYPGVGPEHAALHDSGRVLYTTINDQEAIAAFDLLCRKEGIIPALESSHALAEAIRRAPQLSSEQSIVVNLSGRGDKDMENIRRYKEKHNLL